MSLKQRHGLPEAGYWQPWHKAPSGGRISSKVPEHVTFKRSTRYALALEVSSAYILRTPLESSKPARKPTWKPLCLRTSNTAIPSRECRCKCYNIEGCQGLPRRLLGVFGHGFSRGFSLCERRAGARHADQGCQKMLGTLFCRCLQVKLTSQEGAIPTRALWAWTRSAVPWPGALNF